LLISSIIPLTALNTPAPEASHFLGREAHALFLDLVRRADPTLAETLHQQRGDKPFTVSALTPSPSPLVRGSGWGSGIRAGERYELRITSFESHLAQVIAEQVLPHVPRDVHLGAARFEVGESITDGARHPWAGTTDAGALVDKWFSPARRVEKRFSLEFASPTAYRQIHRNILVPNPAGIFPGYLAAWNASCQPRFEEDLIALVEAEVGISRYALRTQVVDFGEYREAGWVGQCGFTIFSEEIALRRVIHLLADFAFCCGTGYKTTQGMGQTRRA
jgi:CRISPR-associated endoribonuclease Cas6